MKKKIMFGLRVFLGAVILAGCGKPAQNGNQNQESNQNQQQEQAQEGGLTASLKDLMGMGKSQKCTWSVAEGDNKSEGMVYVDGEKFRQDITAVQDDGTEILAYVVSDGEWIYQWSSASKEGTKMQISEMEKMGQEAQTGGGANDQRKIDEEINQNFDYNCEGWNADASKFVVPSDVVFTDMTEMIKNLQQNSQQMMQNVCQMCDSLPAEAKAECLKNCQ